MVRIFDGLMSLFVSWAAWTIYGYGAEIMPNGYSYGEEGSGLAWMFFAHAAFLVLVALAYLARAIFPENEAATVLEGRS